jgi:hypothetical protein
VSDTFAAEAGIIASTEASNIATITKIEISFFIVVFFSFSVYSALLREAPYVVILHHFPDFVNDFLANKYKKIAEKKQELKFFHFSQKPKQKNMQYADIK